METKPALYTTELLITILLEILFGLNTVNIWTYVPENQKWVTVLAQAIVGGFYLLSRGIAKNKGGIDPHNSGNYTMFPTKKRVTER
jgi:hypothetical protein